MSQVPPEYFTGSLTAESKLEPTTADSPTVLKWKTNAPAAEVYVSQGEGPERLLARGTEAILSIPWIQSGRTYSFRLYTASNPRCLLDQITFLKPIVGKLTAFPNPVPLEAGSKTYLKWETTSPASAEIYVSEGGPDERLVCRGASGFFEVSGLRPGVDYCFRLYGGGDRKLLDETEVRLADIPWTSLLERVQASRAPMVAADTADFIANVLPRLLRRGEFGTWFRQWEAQGFHVTPVHFYEPIPDSRDLPEKLWDHPQPLPGVDMNEAMQRKLLVEVFPGFRQEYQSIPLGPTDDKSRFYLENGRFEGIDPMLAYCLMRYFRPRTIIEVGSGFSTLILAEAARANGSTELHSIDPYPQEIVTQGVAGLASLTKKKVQDVELSRFTALDSGDCLFIDTSHVVKIGGDVNFLLLEVLPRLKPGVIVHLHDIFFPFEYPKKWVLRQRRFWTEQYILQAFLAFNAEFTVLVSSGYLNARLAEELRSVFPTISPRGGSFWMRRRVPSSDSAGLLNRDPNEEDGMPHAL